MANTQKLSNGKMVTLDEYGWFQPRDQFRQAGPFNPSEVKEVWALWDVWVRQNAVHLSDAAIETRKRA